MGIYTTDEIKSGRYYTDNCKWLSIDSIAMALNECSDDELITKTDLLKELGLDILFDVINGVVKLKENVSLNSTKEQEGKDDKNN